MTELRHMAVSGSLHWYSLFRHSVSLQRTLVDLCAFQFHYKEMRL